MHLSSGIVARGGVCGGSVCRGGMPRGRATSGVGLSVPRLSVCRGRVPGEGCRLPVGAPGRRVGAIPSDGVTSRRCHGGGCQSLLGAPACGCRRLTLIDRRRWRALLVQRRALSQGVGYFSHPAAQRCTGWHLVPAWCHSCLCGALLGPRAPGGHRLARHHLSARSRARCHPCRSPDEQRAARAWRGHRGRASQRCSAAPANSIQLHIGI